MTEERMVKKILFKNMILNLMVFAMIFYVLGFSVYGQFKNSLYISADGELYKASQMPEFRPDDRKPDEFEEEFLRDNREKQEMDREIFDIKNNPRTIRILRDEDGRFVEDSQENIMLNDIFKNIEFDKNVIGKIYEIDVEGYSYRGINYKNSQDEYIQVLINIDSEKDISEKFIKNLVVSFAITLIVIVFASYMLSRKTLKPVVESWKKQTQFVQDASHELRTPLAIIKAKQEGLLEKPDTKIIDNAEDISITLQETKRLTKLIKELMELAKNDSDKLKLNKEKFNLDSEIKSIIKLYGDVAKTEGKNLNLDLNYKDEIYADPNKIKEVLIILLDNSLKYTEKGDEIEVVTYKKDNKCVIEIIDTGIGISKEAIDHVFERFYREEKSRNRSKGGMGLGLSIAYNIIELHKGTIKFDKTIKKGTRVIVKLPINKF